MIGKERRAEILRIIQSSDIPVSGTEIATKLGVSRQVIVQDIALLRASDIEIMSTTKGYVIDQVKSYTKVLKVCHDDSTIEDELQTIVDLGGTVVDVFVNHKVYGTIVANLNINSRRAVDEFMGDIRSGKSKPLNNVTSGYHYHTIAAESYQELELVEKALKEKGYLIEK